MRFLIACLAVFYCLSTNAKEVRCGWLENPSPSNMWLIDRDGIWNISVQGAVNNLDDKSIELAYQAIADDKDFVRTNNNYEFSCACLTVDLDIDRMLVKTVYKADQLNLKQCLEDVAITEHIPLRLNHK